MAQARAGSHSLRRRRTRSAPAPWLRALRRHSRELKRRLLATWRAAPWQARLAAGAVIAIALWAPVNLAYQVAAKPTELLAPLADWLNKTPAETWRDYAPLFRRNATEAVTPELLASLAQVESAGNPLATTYWHWRFSLNPLAIYRPASSSVGMFQMTDGAFAEARRFCIHEHRVADFADDDASPCGMGATYMRIFPSDAVELTAAYLDRKFVGLTAKRKPIAMTLQQRDNLAAMIHLCGTGPADEYLRHGFHLTPGKHCGDQDVAAYLARVGAMKRQFVELAQADEP
jgi:hypothetical protein